MADPGPQRRNSDESKMAKEIKEIQDKSYGNKIILELISNMYNKYHDSISLMIVVFNTALGMVTISTPTNEEGKTVQERWLTICIGLLNGLMAMIVSISKMKRWDSKSKTAHELSSQFNVLCSSIRLQTTLPENKRRPQEEFLEEMLNKYNELYENMPSIPAKIAKAYKRHNDINNTGLKMPDVVEYYRTSIDETRIQIPPPANTPSSSYQQNAIQN